MKAGDYAEVDGRLCPADVSPYLDDVRLLDWGAGAPEGYTFDGRRGHWYRDVPRAACTSLAHAATSAWWRGVFPVVVEQARTDGTAVIGYAPDGHPGPPPRDTDGRPLLPPLPADHGAGYRGVVPLDELSGVVTVMHPIPLDRAADTGIRTPAPALTKGRRG